YTTLFRSVSRREDFDRRIASLVGRRIESVAYWDVHLGDAPRVWDFGDWHHAVMGVDLGTDHGPVAVLWTSTFYPYGVEVFESPVAQHLELGELGPETWPTSEHPEWESRAGQGVRAADVFWERFTPGSSAGLHGVEPGPDGSIEVPVALRLDLDAGPVWFVAGTPQERGPILLGDEIVVVFSGQTMQAFGFPSGDF